MFKKGQGATEYLIILAVIIIIALIVVGAMGGIPGIGSGAKNRASASYWQTSDIAVQSYAAHSATDDLNVTVRNNLPNPITLTSVTVGGGTQTCVRTSLAAGESTKCSDEDGATGCSGEGDSFNYPVSIAYTDDQTAAAYTFTGEGRTLSGTCAT
jgi:type II secretory pathway pseudopilin PulG